MDFLFFYEINTREIETLTLLKNELEYRGYKCAISHFSAWGYGINMLKNPKVIITPWLRDDNNVYTFTRNIYKTTKIVNLQSEQIYSEEDEKFGYAKCTGTAKKAYHVCWGQQSRDRLANQDIKIDNLPILGSIKMDFFSPLFQSFYKTRNEIGKQYKLNPNKKWRLFISSLAYSTYYEKDLQILYKQAGDFSDWVQFNRKTRTELLDWFEELTGIDDEIEFIYRPHPSENIDDTLLSLESRRKNFHVINSLSLPQWIFVSDTIDVWYSTAIAEIYFCGKICNILRPYEVPDKYEIDLYKGGKFITTKNDYIYSHKSNATKIFPIDVHRIKELYNQTNIPSYIRTADFLESVLNNNDKIDFYTNLTPNEKFHAVRQYLKSMVGDIVRKTNIEISKHFSIDSYIYKVFSYIEAKAIGIDAYIRECIDKTKDIVEQYYKNN